MDFGSVTLTKASTNSFTYNGFVAKLIDIGNASSFVWAQRASGTGDNTISALGVSGSNVYVAGGFNSTINVGPNTFTHMGNGDIFVAKLADAGSTANFVWGQRAGGTGVDGSSTLAVSGNYIYVGSMFRSATADFGATTLTNAGNNTGDMCVAKLTDAGNTGSFVWAQRAGSVNEEIPYALAINGTSLYVVGEFEGTTAGFGSITISNAPYFGNTGFLASLTDPTLTATTAAIPREPAQLYPNPARHAATLRLPAGTAPAPLTLTDALGRPVRRYPAPAGPETSLDLRGLPAGLYLLRGAGPAQRLAVE
ncbi:T9SS type A sorting domain-containing protein [Hymenobacter convexus]|uniref:T9SS type A sorting domain-containing protein n=1 Tax=Hymenobacter sp. CA1UV-4 TaxID=3063782 RepID=UPI002712B167|nr:T9SS type A sorting domain-containing protein [Hymenobacter sp. CA1UV-4]MDO7852678.1 T9SS type A sorting domain-containing protein [Hymenobacter sp. CA1UV-4]